MDIQRISARTVSVEGTRSNTVLLDIDGIDADDFVACASVELINGIIRAAGEEICVEVLGIKVAE